MLLVYLPPAAPAGPKKFNRIVFDTQEKLRNFEGKQRALLSMWKWWRHFPLALFTFKRTNWAVVNFTLQI